MHTSGCPYTSPHPHWALPPCNTFLLTLAHSASVAIATWLHALHPHQVCVMVENRNVRPCVHQGEVEIQPPPTVAGKSLVCFV